MQKKIFVMIVIYVWVGIKLRKNGFIAVNIDKLFECCYVLPNS